MAEELSGEGNLPQQEGDKETTTRSKCKEIAKAQLGILGYTDFIQQLSDILQNKGTLGKLGQLKPHVFGGVKENFDAFAKRMQRVPNTEEAVSLLETAIFGEPAKRNSDGTIVVTSFSLAEPSTTTSQRKFLMLRDKRDDTHFVPNTIGTDRLMREFISKTGFQKEDETVETVFHLKKGKQTTLIHPQDNSLVFDIEPPTDSGRNDTPTAYTYQVQTVIK